MATTRVILNWNNKLKAAEAGEDEIGVSEAVLKVARKELREDKQIRDQSLEQFREWLKQNTDVANIRTDDLFLLKFLRAKKFSIPMAEQLLLKFLNFKKVFHHLTSNLDFMDPPLLQLINKGYLVPSPIRDKLGRKVIIGFAKNFDPDVHNSADMAKIHLLTYETLLEDAENQIMGFVHVGDFQGVTTSHIACWNPSDFMRMLKWGEQSIPMRHKEIHFCNIPSPVKWLIDVGKTRVSNKIKDRLNVYVTPNDMLKKVDPSCLPKEMGGKIPMADMIELWKHELAAKRDIVKTIDSMDLLSDRGIITKHDKNGVNSGKQQIEASIVGSFRKLEVD